MKFATRTATTVTLAACLAVFVSVAALTAPLLDVAGGTDHALPQGPTNPVSVSVDGGSGGTVKVSATVNPTGVALANSTSSKTALTGAAQTITLTAASTNVTIINDSTDKLYIQFSGAAATNAIGYLPANFGYTFTGLPAVTTVSVLGPGTGNAVVFAH